jgi:hypothetical protein
MTAKRIISQAEAERLADLATTAGVEVEIERNGTLVRIRPYQATTDLAAWRLKRKAGR